MNIEDFLQNNKPEGKRSKILVFHTEVLKLHELGYSLNQISKFLLENGVKISAPAISNYLKKTGV